LRRLVRISLLGLGIATFVVLVSGCGGGGGGEEAATTTEAETMTTMTTERAAKGDVTAGKAVFASAGCGGCHTFKAAGSMGTTGPNLDKHLAEHKKEGGDLSEHVRESIVDPDAELAEGYEAGVMPSYRTRLTAKQLDDLVAFIVANT
jgi:mono/diheme cytochrome c family protein